MIISLENAVSACFQALQTDSELASACQTLGNMLQAMGRFSAALQWHTWAIALPDDRTSMFTRLGALYGQQRCWEQAIAAYQQAIQHNPDYAPAHWSLANLYAELGDTAAEIHHRERAIQCDAAWATSKNQFRLGNQLMTAQRSLEAVAYYQGAVDRNPDFFEAHYNLAIALIAQRNWTEVQAALQRSIALEPYAPAFYALGQVAQQQNDWQAAQTHFRQAAEQDSSYQLAWCGLGEASLKLHDWDTAVCAFQQAKELGESASILYGLGYALLKQQQFDAAASHLQQAIELEPNPWFYLHLAESQLGQQQWHSATAALLQALQQQPDLDALFLPLGQSLRCLRIEAENAAAIVSDLLYPANRQPEFYGSIAAALAVRQQWEGAALFYELAIGQGAPVQSQLQQIQTQQQQMQQAIDFYQQQIDRFPQQDESYTKLAHLFADRGDYPAAIALHRRALALKGWQAANDRDYLFLRDWFSHNIPVWQQQLREFGHRPLRAIEVGCCEGMASCWLLDHVLTHAEARLVCIDSYLQENFTTNIQRASATQKVIRRLGDSRDWLARLERASYDLIYLSGDPRADRIYQDAELSWQLLRSGGMLIFDYYGWIDQEPIEQRSQIGIDRFLDATPSAFLLHRGYQVIVRKVEDNQ